jgi:hypothetical protein
MHRATYKQLRLLVTAAAVLLWQGVATPALGATYHGNQNSHAFHAPGCRDFNCPNCTKIFTSYAAAVNAGYHPHKECVDNAKETKPGTLSKPQGGQAKTSTLPAKRPDNNANGEVRPERTGGSESVSPGKPKPDQPGTEESKLKLTLKEVGTYRDKTLVQGAGEVSRILADDKEGIKHQRFILKLASGQTLLVAHNTDVGQRVENLQVGDIVEFYGESAENNEGGVVHWTHRDLKGVHPNGWLKVKGQTYQ